MTRREYLDSAILRLVKERNDTRELVRRLVYSSVIGTDSQEFLSALGDAFRMSKAWKEGGE